MFAAYDPLQVKHLTPELQEGVQVSRGHTVGSSKIFRETETGKSKWNKWKTTQADRLKQINITLNVNGLNAQTKGRDG